MLLIQWTRSRITCFNGHYNPKQTLSEHLAKMLTNTTPMCKNNLYPKFYHQLLLFSLLIYPTLEYSRSTFTCTVDTQLHGIRDSGSQQISQQKETFYQSLIQNITWLQTGIDSVTEISGNQRRINELTEDN